MGVVRVQNLLRMALSALEFGLKLELHEEYSS